MNANTREIGAWGEGLAAAFLTNAGYMILRRNYHTAQGEIDIIAISPEIQSPCLVFVEVKTRSNPDHGYPEEAVSRTKWRRIQAVIQRYLEDHEDQAYDWRVDVIAILGQPGGDEAQIQHYENVVMPDERY